MYFLSESCGNSLFNEMLGRFVFLLPYIWIGGGVWTGSSWGTAAASSSPW